MYQPVFVQWLEQILIEHPGIALLPGPELRQRLDQSLKHHASQQGLTVDEMRGVVADDLRASAPNSTPLGDWYFGAPEPAPEAVLEAENALRTVLDSVHRPHITADPSKAKKRRKKGKKR